MTGVPKGSELVTTQSLLFTNDFLFIASSPVHFFSDHATLHCYLSCHLLRKHQHRSWLSCCQRISKLWSRIHLLLGLQHSCFEWCLQNHSAFNPSETSFVLYTCVVWLPGTACHKFRFASQFIHWLLFTMLIFRQIWVGSPSLPYRHYFGFCSWEDASTVPSSLVTCSGPWCIQVAGQPYKVPETRCNTSIFWFLTRRIVALWNTLPSLSLVASVTYSSAGNTLTSWLVKSRKIGI